MPNSWSKALKEWNDKTHGNNAFCIPKKKSRQYVDVVRIQKRIEHGEGPAHRTRSKKGVYTTSI
eukprot:523500-Hanusia_phi.AAC.1